MHGVGRTFLQLKCEKNQVLEWHFKSQKTAAFVARSSLYTYIVLSSLHFNKDGRLRVESNRKQLLNEIAVKEMSWKGNGKV